MRQIELGVVTDEISRDLAKSLDYCRKWELRRIELREGSEKRYPGFTEEECRLVDSAVADGFSVTAVSPGILKCHADDDATIRTEFEEILPASIDLAQRFGAPMLISFGFEKSATEAPSNRTRAMKTLERFADRVWKAGLILAIENEPDFWVDDAADEAKMLEEIGHPALKANWDPANSHWGGSMPTRDGFDALKQHIVNVHVKDFTSSDPDIPWRPVGQGETPWTEFIPWVVNDTDIAHITVETHAPPLVENTRDSLIALREMLGMPPLESLKTQAL